MLKMELSRVIDLVNGKVIHGDITKYGSRIISGICIDSRKAESSTVFVPIVGEKVDAHRFIPQVFESECFVSLTQEDKVDGIADTDKVLIRVDNNVQAVQNLAAEYRKTFNVPVVGITGSVGKTTTREMITLALSAGKRVYATPGNKNSQIGTPDTILNFDDSAEICVFEMGMSMPGEMTKLAAMVRPDAAVFTNIGVTHIENLGSRQAILDEKMHITDHMCDGSVVFVNNDNDMLNGITLRQGLIKCTYGLTPESDVYAEDIDESEGYPSFTAVVNGKKVKVNLNTYGRFQIYNALAGLAVADHFGIDLKKSAEKLAEFNGYSHRNQIFKNDKITVIDDTYNAAPDSMRGAIDMLSSIRCEGRRIAVLGDMKELGDIAEKAHHEIGCYAKNKGNVDILISYGPLAKGISYGFDGRESLHTEDPDELFELIKKNVKTGDLVLFKGSNSMKLFDFVDKVLNYDFM